MVILTNTEGSRTFISSSSKTKTVGGLRGILLVLCLLVGTNISAQFVLPPLPYSYSALEPFIDSTTMRIHHTMHHATYVKNLNRALEGYPQLQQKDIDELLKTIDQLPKEIQVAVRNNGGGHYNHSLFWTMLAPANSTQISEKTMLAISKNFGSVEKFREEFEKEAVSRFGSGWVWLIKKPDGQLIIASTPNQDNVLMGDIKIEGTPILALDVWEHAYYLKYQSKRAAYVKAFWNIVNWDKVNELLDR